MAVPAYSMAAGIDKGAVTMAQSSEDEEISLASGDIAIQDEAAPLSGSYKLGMGNSTGGSSFFRVLSIVLGVIAIGSVITVVYREGRKASQFLKEL